MKQYLSAVVIGLALTAPAMAEPVVGTWASPPDGKGQTGHVVIRECGGAYCGRLERAFDPVGRPIVTKNVGRELLSNLKAQGGGAYQGRAFVPIFGKSFDAEVNVAGNRMTVRGCAGPVCKKQVWKRVN